MTDDPSSHAAAPQRIARLYPERYQF